MPVFAVAIVAYHNHCPSVQITATKTTAAHIRAPSTADGVPGAVPGACSGDAAIMRVAARSAASAACAWLIRSLASRSACEEQYVQTTQKDVQHSIFVGAGIDWMGPLARQVQGCPCPTVYSKTPSTAACKGHSQTGTLCISPDFPWHALASLRNLPQVTSAAPARCHHPVQLLLLVFAQSHLWLMSCRGVEAWPSVMAQCPTSASQSGSGPG